MDKVKRLKELNALLQKASYAYYGLDKPIMSDKEYDNLFDELKQLEDETGVIMSNSPVLICGTMGISYMDFIKNSFR